MWWDRLKSVTDHDCLVALENAAISSFTASRLDDCRQFIQTLLERLNQVYGGGANPRALKLSMHLASLLLIDKRPDDALETFTSCLKLTTYLLGETSDSTLSCLDGMGKCYFLLGDFEVLALQKFNIFGHCKLSDNRRIVPIQQADAFFHRSLVLHSSVCKSLQATKAPSSCPTCQRSHNNVALVAVARRSSHAVHLRLSSDLKPQ